MRSLEIDPEELRNSLNSPGDPVLSDSAQAGDIPQEEPSRAGKVWYGHYRKSP